ncbi:MAG: biopolymer transporter ExbD [Proteobacteria bacterium]|nr:biopolymer transporter ExbD [Pseudomonadota bacterium]MBU4295962.1 biopolymer transporter ExbD [Pseudomonadota bacterium]MCG2746172.1 biopolymer transporter ExbD [Desulfobulbaceae bacterium]
MDEKEFDYLNVVPLVDVMLVLLTIVLTTSTFIATGGIPVELPRASASAAECAKRPQTVVISKDGRVRVNTQELSLASLGSAMAPLSRDTPVVVRADKHLPLQSFVDVIDVIKKLGFKTVSLQTEQRI